MNSITTTLMHHDDGLKRINMGGTASPDTTLVGCLRVLGGCKDTTTYLDETNVLGVQLEALTAHHESVLADDGVLVGANTATRQQGRWHAE